MFKKFLFATTLVSIAMAISIAGYLFFAKQNPALAQATIYDLPADRKISWSPGISGGIPTNYTLCANVKNAPYNTVDFPAACRGVHCKESLKT